MTQIFFNHPEDAASPKPLRMSDQRRQKEDVALSVRCIIIVTRNESYNSTVVNAGVSEIESNFLKFNDKEKKKEGKA